MMIPWWIHRYWNSPFQEENKFDLNDYSRRQWGQADIFLREFKEYVIYHLTHILTLFVSVCVTYDCLHHCSIMNNTIRASIMPCYDFLAVPENSELNCSASRPFPSHQQRSPLQGNDRSVLILLHEIRTTTPICNCCYCYLRLSPGDHSDFQWLEPLQSNSMNKFDPPLCP